MQTISISSAWLAILASTLPSLSAGEGAGDMSLAGLGNLLLGSAYSREGSTTATVSPVLTAPDGIVLAAAGGAPAGAGGGAVAPLGPGDSRVGRLLLKGGIGFTAGPKDFLLALEGDYFFTNGLAIGPLIQFGLPDDPFILAPSLNFKGIFDLRGIEGLKPVVEGGLGLVYMDDDHRRGDDEDTGFLLNFGGGLQYFVDDHVAVGSEMLFNIIPGDVLDENFFFSWQVVTLSFLF